MPSRAQHFEDNSGKNPWDGCKRDKKSESQTAIVACVSRNVAQTAGGQNTKSCKGSVSFVLSCTLFLISCIQTYVFLLCSTCDAVSTSAENSRHQIRVWITGLVIIH